MLAQMPLIDFDRLERIATERRAAFAAADPFPFTVIDEFLPEATAEQVLAEFPDQDAAWNHYHHYNEKKLALNRVAEMGPVTRAVFDALQSDRFLRIVETLSGVDDLIADPDLDGAGLHMIRRGGFLNVHTDFLSHTKNRHWSRQINLLIYFNRDWPDDWNGNLELWSGDMTRRVQSINPRFNRCVIFRTRERSFHGHPGKLACPDGDSRRSIALYYFRDEGEVKKLAPTNYRARPEDSLSKSALIAADRWLLRGYSFLKRYTGLSDGLIDRILRRF
ncbi:MAG: 2OG-Fe(II) oxygenase [Candidatus Eiseniibacteriota bacterium]